MTPLADRSQEREQWPELEPCACGGSAVHGQIQGVACSRCARYVFGAGPGEASAAWNAMQWTAKGDHVARLQKQEVVALAEWTCQACGSRNTSPQCPCLFEGGYA